MKRGQRSSPTRDRSHPMGRLRTAGVARRRADDHQARRTARLRAEPAAPARPPTSIPPTVSGLSRRQLACKRLFDVSVILALLPLAILVAAVAALLVRAFSRGPVLYRQVRVGLGGRHFVLYKLHTMIEHAEARDGATFSHPDDPRLTRVGKHLKALHLDELPQLWNVLRGDMSLVGPRPERPVFVRQFANRIADYERRHQVPVGLTGLAQLKGDHATSAEDKLVHDLAYASRWSIFGDLKLLARTPSVVLGNLRRRNSRTGAPSGGAESKSTTARPWVIYLSPVPWLGPRQRQHELATQLAQEFRVLFLESPTGRGSAGREPLAIEDNLWVLGPRVPLRLARVIPPLNLATRLALSRRLTRWLADQDAPAVLWVDEDLAAACAGRSGETAVVYDAADVDWTFTRRWNRWHLKRAMKLIRRRAGVTLSSSATLIPDLPRSEAKTVLVPNAGDPDHFRPEGPKAPELEGLQRPILGFIGTASTRALDLDLLEGIARRRPDWSLVIVGRCEDAVRSRLAAHDNIMLLGERPYESLPALVRAFDICTIPYRVGATIDYVLPKKLFEYLAAGRPVVGTPLPELQRFQPHVRLAASVEDFVRAAELSLWEEVSSDDDLAAQTRRAVALENTWERRGHVVRRVVADLLAAA